MKTRFLAYLSLLVLGHAHSGELKNVKECSIGKRVSDRNEIAGVVTEIRNGMCVVRRDDGSEKSYLHWMLSPVNDPKKPTAKGLPAGSYVCSAYGAGSFKVIIREAGLYLDRAGNSGAFTLKNNQDIVFESGSLKGQYSRLLAPGKFGLASANRKAFNTVCNLK